MNGTPSRTPALEAALHHGATALAGLTGVAYFVLKDLVEPDPDSFSVVSHPWQPHAQHLHVVLAPLMLVSFGVLLRHHVLGRLASSSWRRSRRTGLGLVASFVPMAFSGYLLQVSVDDAWRALWKWTHLATGAAFLGGYLVHLALSRLRR